MPVCLLAGCPSINLRYCLCSNQNSRSVLLQHEQPFCSCPGCSFNHCCVHLRFCIKKEILKRERAILSKTCGFKADLECDKCFQSINIFFILFPPVASSRCFWNQLNILSGFDKLPTSLRKQSPQVLLKKIVSPVACLVDFGYYNHWTARCANKGLRKSK